jgi:large subunit ribosomal protein L32
MALPKRRTTRSRRGMRRAGHDKVARPNTIACPNCGDMMVPHRVCPECGHYKGRQVVVKKKKEDKTKPATGGAT